jgi:predicted adenylyl cyclase CyaB
MREIEIKAQIDETDKLKLILHKLGFTFGNPTKQHDVIYGQRNEKNDAWVHGRQWFRVRTENDTKQIFTMKRTLGKGLDSLEHETVVDDGQDMLRILEDLGFEHYCTVTKIRQKAKQGELEVCLDHVAELDGDFIEVEKIVDLDASHDDTMAELWEFMAKLGIDRKDEITDGYDILLQKQRGEQY